VKIILIPTDFSASSKNVIECVLSFLKEVGEDYKLLLLNTYLVPTSQPEDLIAVHDELRKKSREGLEDQRKKMESANLNARISFDTLSHMGTLENVIPHIVKNHHIDCVVMGIDQEKRKCVLEKTYSHILNSIMCPLMIVPTY